MRRVMLCGETLVAQCKDENWWRSVISSSDSAAIEKRILLHLKEFRLCVNMLRLIANSGVPPDGTFLRPVVLDPSTLDVEEACRKDIESLFSAIEGYKRTSYAKGDVTKLAEYVLNKAAAKVFTASSSSVIKAVENEANLQARLRHPNVVQFIGYAVKGSQHIIVTELMTMDLRRYLDENLRGLCRGGNAVSDSVTGSQNSTRVE
ncbi:unnamed protein product [Sphagnum jensenii]|uniref:Serine-threonine/tyrosine-protein kinase catalytic domain-containing protein n=1 Tax=Sphagnum jensenii TaxID=128206 RepID=A0ABP0VT94_9BRYO